MEADLRPTASLLMVGDGFNGFRYSMGDGKKDAQLHKASPKQLPLHAPRSEGSVELKLPFMASHTYTAVTDDVCDEWGSRGRMWLRAVEPCW